MSTKRQHGKPKPKKGESFTSYNRRLEIWKANKDVIVINPTSKKKTVAIKDLEPLCEISQSACTGAVYLPPHVTQPVEHPAHYGGKENPYEAIKVIDAWDLGFNTGNALKYIARAGKKGSAIIDLKKAIEYLKFEINKLEKQEEA